MSSAEQLEAQLHEALMQGYRETADKYWVPTRFLRTLNEEGAVATANRYSSDPHPSDGFQRLWELGRLDLSVEAIALPGS